MAPPLGSSAQVRELAGYAARGPSCLSYCRAIYAKLAISHSNEKVSCGRPTAPENVCTEWASHWKWEQLCATETGSDTNEYGQELAQYSCSLGQ